MAIRYFSIITNEEAFSMDATLQVSRVLNSRVTEFPVEDGGFASDNIVNTGDEISFSGVITDINSSTGEDISSVEFISKIEKIRNSKQIVSVSVGLTEGAGNPIRVINSCVLLNASFKQDPENGIAGGTLSSYKVSLSFKKIRIIAPATRSFVESSVKVKSLTIIPPETPKEAPITKDTSSKTDPALEARRRSLGRNSILSDLLSK